MKAVTASPKRSLSPGVPKVSKQRQALLARWLSSVLEEKKLNVENLAEACKTGVLLAKTLEHYGCSLSGVIYKPAAKKSCLHNLELVLSFIWKKGVPARMMPTAEELLSGTSHKVWLLLNYIFENIVMNEVRASLREMSAWTNRILASYGKRLQVTSINSPFSTLPNDLSSGAVYGCLLNSFCNSISTSSRVKMESRQLYGNPRRAEEFTHNIAHVLCVAIAANIPVCFTVEEFHEAGPDFLLLQLYNFYNAFKGYKPSQAPYGFFRDSSHTDAPSTNTSLGYSPSPIRPASPLSFDSMQSLNLPPHQSFSDLAKKKVTNKNYYESSKQDDFSLSSDVGNRRLKVLEHLNAQQERRFMYIADARRRKELELEQKPEPEPASPTPKSLTYEACLCFLMTPRVLNLSLGDEWADVSVNLVPNESMYSLHSEAYLFEWCRLEELENTETVDVFNIVSVKKDSGVSFLLTESSRTLSFACKSTEECDQYVAGFSYVLQKVQRKK